MRLVKMPVAKGSATAIGGTAGRECGAGVEGLYVSSGSSVPVADDIDRPEVSRIELSDGDRTVSKKVHNTAVVVFDNGARVRYHQDHGVGQPQEEVYGPDDDEPAMSSEFVADQEDGRRNVAEPSAKKFAVEWADGDVPPEWEEIIRGE